MNRSWRRFTGMLLAPFLALGALFWAVKDGFIRRSITLKVDDGPVTYTGSTAVLIGLGLVLTALVLALVAYKFWIIEDPIGPD